MAKFNAADREGLEKQAEAIGIYQAVMGGDCDRCAYMDCWHFIAPLIPKNTDFAREVYVMTFNALKDAEEQRKKKPTGDKK